MTDTCTTAVRLWHEWTRMWNDDPALALRLVAPRFRLHLSVAQVDPRTVTDPESVRRWVADFRQRFTRLVFTPGCGPFFDEAQNTVSGPWIADITLDGVTRQSCGIDILRLDDGRVCEYWTLSNPVASAGEWNDLLVR